MWRVVKSYNLANDGDGCRMQFHELKQLGGTKSASVGGMQKVKDKWTCEMSFILRPKEWNKCDRCVELVVLFSMSPETELNVYFSRSRETFGPLVALAHHMALRLVPDATLAPRERRRTTQRKTLRT